MPFDTDTDTYGSERYTWIADVRYRIGFSRTLLPVGHETNRQFEERMNVLAQRLAALPDVKSFEVEIRVKKGIAVEAIVHVTLVEPELAPIADDDRPTGRAESRGCRGRGGVAQFALN